jgi:hypothetical protein
MLIDSSLAPTTTYPSSNPPTYSLHLWSDGKFHRLSETFLFPEMNVGQAWLMWWEGNIEKAIPPYSRLENIDIPKKEKRRWSDICCMMNALIQSLFTHYPQLTIEELQSMNSLRLSECCVMAVEKLPRRPRKLQTRWTEWMVTTAIRELRQTLTKKNPDRKRKQCAPKKVTKRKRVKRTEIK